MVRLLHRGSGVQWSRSARCDAIYCACWPLVTVCRRRPIRHHGCRTAYSPRGHIRNHGRGGSTTHRITGSVYRSPGRKSFGLAHMHWAYLTPAMPFTSNFPHHPCSAAQYGRPRAIRRRERPG